MQPTRKIDPEVSVYNERFSKFIIGIKATLKDYQHTLDIQQHEVNGETTETKVIITLKK